MTPLDTLLIACIASLGGVIGILFKLLIAEKDARRAEQAGKQETTRLMFGLLGLIKSLKGERPPPTKSEWDDEPNTQVTNLQLDEAKDLAKAELNGDVESIVKDFLSQTSTPKPRRIP